MPTSYKDQFYTIDPGNPPASGTPVSFTRQTFTDGNDDGLIQPNVGDTFEGTQVISVWQNDSVTINVPGIGNVTYTGTTFYLDGGLPAVFTPTDGQVLQNGTFVSSTYVTNSTQMPVANTGPTCFTPGTMIRTPGGLTRIEELQEGDAVQTKDNGAQQIRWIGSRRMSGARLFAMPKLRPVRIAAGLLGADVPEGDLVVSPEHRILIKGPVALDLFNTPEVLVAAKDLINGTSISVDLRVREVTYIHLLFDRHQVMWANGVETESFHPASASLNALDDSDRARLLATHPSLEFDPHTYGSFARRHLSGSEAAILNHAA